MLAYTVNPVISSTKLQIAIKIYQNLQMRMSYFANFLGTRFQNTIHGREGLWPKRLNPTPTTPPHYRPKTSGLAYADGTRSSGLSGVGCSLYTDAYVEVYDVVLVHMRDTLTDLTQPADALQLRVIMTHLHRSGQHVHARHSDHTHTHTHTHGPFTLQQSSLRLSFTFFLSRDESCRHVVRNVQ